MRLNPKYYFLPIGIIVILGGLIFIFGKNFQNNRLSPKNLKCTIEDFAIKLHWQAPLVQDVITYNIYRKSEYGDIFQKIAQNTIPREYHDKTETDPYTNYNYYVTSIDSSGKESIPSNIAICKIQKNQTIPFLKKFFAGLVNPDSSFTANNLVFDADFINTTALSTSEIQSFLESKNSVLATIDPKRLCGTTPANCDNTKTAAQLIYEAATLKDSEGNPIGVNPAVLLVTMQKEQSLITKTSWTEEGLQYALDWAMGYAVYENGTRIEALKGFRQQLLGGEDSEGNFWWGSSQSMRNNYELGRGPNVDSLCRAYGDQPKNPSYFGGYCSTFEVTNSTYYYNVPSKQKVTPENKSTMALYRYTPHVFNGNYNFWYYWNYWFGSIYNVKILSYLSLNAYNLVEGNILEANFSIKNYNKISMKLDRLKVDVRGDGEPQDIYGVSDITIGPGDTFSFLNPPPGIKIYKTKVLNDVGSYNAKIKLLFRNKWYSVSGAVSRNLTIRAIQPTDLYLDPALSLSPSSIYDDQKVTANFTIYNKTKTPLFLQRLKVSIWEGSKYYDITGYSNETLTTSLIFSKNNSRTIPEAGTYTGSVRVQVNGKWITPSGNISRILKVRWRIGALSVTSQLTLNAYSLVEGNILKASFSIKNNGNFSITLDRLKVDVRGSGNAQDIYGVSNLILSPGQILSFSSPPPGVTIYNKRVLTDIGSYTAILKMLYKNKWYAVSGAKSRNLTIREIHSTDLYLNPALSLSPNPASAGDTITGSFTIYNKTNIPILLQRLKVSIWKGSKYYDLNGHSNETLKNSLLFSKNNSRIINEIGIYKARVNVKINGKWFMPSGNIDRTLKVE